MSRKHELRDLVEGEQKPMTFREVVREFKLNEELAEKGTDDNLRHAIKQYEQAVRVEEMKPVEKGWKLNEWQEGFASAAHTVAAKRAEFWGKESAE